MQFRSIASYSAPALTASSRAVPSIADLSSAETVRPALRPLVAPYDDSATPRHPRAHLVVAQIAEPEVKQSKAADTLQATSENLMKHIPGEATGFYLLAAGAFVKPDIWTLGIIFVLALILLVLVRWLAHASRAIMTTTIIAFLLWMLILDNGFIHALFPAALMPPWGFIIVTFYTIAVALLANAGKIK